MRTGDINICYYITGHGLGHVTRSIEIISELLKQKQFNIHVVSSFDDVFFLNRMRDGSLSLGVYLHIHKRLLDSGAVQSDALTVDIRGTLERYYNEIHLNEDQLLDTEERWLLANRIDVVIVDATPLAIAAANRAHIKHTILFSNFSWCFIFKEMFKILQEKDSLTTDEISKYQEMINQSELHTSLCDHVLAYPGETPFSSFLDPSKIIHIPLVARRARNSSVTRSELNLSSDDKVVLLSFGGFSCSDWQLQDYYLPDGWICLVLGAKESDLPSKRFLPISFDSYVPDYIHICNAVLGKIGYGFVSECLADGAPLIYVPRYGWPEEPYLEELLIRYGAGIRMNYEDFSSGRWEFYLNQAYLLRDSWHIEAAQHPDQAIPQVMNIITTIISS